LEKEQLILQVEERIVGEMNVAKSSRGGSSEAQKRWKPQKIRLYGVSWLEEDSASCRRSSVAGATGQESLMPQDFLHRVAEVGGRL
jgi:hypothetical protein